MVSYCADVSLWADVSLQKPYENAAVDANHFT